MDIDQVKAALNGAADSIEEACKLPESGVIDAINLMINATLHYLEHPGATLREVIAAEYDEETTYEDVISWIED